MELLYIWINKYQCINQQGFNFSPEYEFSIENSSEKWTFSMKETGKINIMKKGCVVNLTAIVGENGAGKTTLMSYLNNLNCFPKFKKDDEEYEKSEENRYLKNMNMIVTREQEDIILYTNIDPEKIEYIDCNKIQKVNMYEQNQVVRELISNSNGFYNLTSIYETNSSYGVLNGSSSHNGLESLVITPFMLSGIKDAFYECISPEKGIFIEEKKGFDKYCLILKKSKSIAEFQQICDILFFDKLIREKKFQNYCGHIKTELLINVSNIPSVMQDNKEKGDIDEIINQAQNRVALMYDKNKGKQSIIYMLKCNFIAEILMCLENKEEFSNQIEIEGYYNQILNLLDEDTFTINGYKTYFNNAMVEIEELSTIIEDGLPLENYLPIDDLAYKTGIKLNIDFNTNDEKRSAYSRFCKLIAEKAYMNSKLEKNDYGSFLLKYIRIDNLAMSSGERAFQNLMSWMAIIPELKKISIKTEFIPKKNILLCLDEIDLYCHPQWQRDFVYTMLDEIKSEYEGYSVQIIVSTHSPLCLSDIPVENIIYLKQGPKGTEVDKKESHKQTFGKNLYEILNDSFYLGKMTMGRYANQYIKDLIKEIEMIKPNCFKKDIDYLMKKIDVIGDVLIKYQLNEKLSKKITKSNKELEIQTLKEQKLKIDNQLKSLLGDTYDTN